MARRRSGWDEFAKGFGLGQQMVEKWNDTQLKKDLTEVGKIDEIQYSQYSPEQIAEIESRVNSASEYLKNSKDNPDFDPAERSRQEAILANPYEGLTPANKRYSLNGVDRDTAFSDIEKDGLRAAALARVYEKHGRGDSAMQMRSLARTMEKENRELEMQRREDEIVKSTTPGSPEEMIKMGVDMYAKNEGVGGYGKNAGMTLDPVKMLNGNYRVTVYDKDGNAAGAYDKTEKELLGIADRYVSQNRMARLAANNPGKWQGELNRMMRDDRNFAETVRANKQTQANWEATHQAGREDAKATQDYKKQHLEMLKAELEEKRNERAEGRNSIISLEDVQGNAKPYSFNSKTGVSTPINLPEGMRLPGHKDKSAYSPDELALIKRIDEERIKQGVRPRSGLHTVLPWNSDAQDAWDDNDRWLKDMDPRQARLRKAQAEEAKGRLDKAMKDKTAKPPTPLAPAKPSLPTIGEMRGLGGAAFVPTAGWGPSAAERRRQAAEVERLRKEIEQEEQRRNFAP